MRVYIKQRKGIVNAVAEYNPITKQCVVFAGSVLSDKIASSDKFKGANTIKKARDGKVNGNVLKEDVTFNSASTASNFVTGSSTNGFLAWKNDNGVCLKKVLEGDAYEQN